MSLQARPRELRAGDEVPPEIEEIHVYRVAARAIVRDGKRAQLDRLIALCRLAEKARAEAALPRWCQQAVWEESAGFLQGRSKAPPESGEPLERAVRRLHARGLYRCPTCLLLLPDEATLDRWRSVRLAEALKPELPSLVSPSRRSPQPSTEG